MLKLRNTRRAIAVASSTLALAGGLTFANATAAHASGCTVIDIGSPGNIYVNGEYAGQVEQQYDNCGNARAHFQYSYWYQQNHQNDPLPDNWSATACIYSVNGNEACSQESNSITYEQNVYSPWAGIHDSNPDTWVATVQIALCGQVAYGSWHAYANGGNSAASPACAP